MDHIRKYISFLFDYWSVISLIRDGHTSKKNDNLNFYSLSNYVNQTGDLSLALQGGLISFYEADWDALW